MIKTGSDFSGVIWTDVKEYVGIYKISNVGDIVGLDRVTNNPVNLTTKGLPLKYSIKRGYKCVVLQKEGKRIYPSIHRIVAIAFIPNPKNKPCVNHINGIKTDNRVENLEWCTQKENVNHAFDNNLRKLQNGASNINAKLTEIQVLEIRSLKNKGVSQVDIRKMYGMSRSNVNDIVNNRIWKKLV